METKPLVSVLMTVYNEEEHLQEALDGVLGQTLRDIEVLIIDDGSSDGTAEILQAAAKKDSRLKVISMGRVANRPKLLNMALQWSRGEYVAIQDADDVALPLRLERQYELLEQHPGVGVVGTACVVVDRQRGIERHIRRPAASNRAIRASMFKGIPFAHSTMMMRRDLVIELGAYDERYSYPHDYDLIFRIARVAKLAAIPDVLVISRSSGFYASKVSVRKRMRELRQCRQAHWRGLGRLRDLRHVWLSPTIPLAKYAFRQMLMPASG